MSSAVPFRLDGKRKCFSDPSLFNKAICGRASPRAHRALKLRWINQPRPVLRGREPKNAAAPCWKVAPHDYASRWCRRMVSPVDGRPRAISYQDRNSPETQCLRLGSSRASSGV